MQMSPPSCFCTLSTSTCAHELVGLVLSLSIHHPYTTIYILADSETQRQLKTMTPQPRLTLIWDIALDAYSGKSRAQMSGEGIWREFMTKKAFIIQRALQDFPDVLFLDSDILLTAPITDIDHTKELGVSPQIIGQRGITLFGKYNGGMLWTRNASVPDDWIEFTKTSRYEEQAAIEDLARKYSFFEFDDSHNVQCWRLVHFPQGPDAFSKLFHVGAEGVLYNGKLLKSVHTHWDDKQFHAFNNLILTHFNCARQYASLAIVFRILFRKWVIRIPKQPIDGDYTHSNDCFRELAVRFASAHSDVVVQYETNTAHCWLSPNILLYDRDNLLWMNTEVKKATLCLLGNGNVTVDKPIIQKGYPRLPIRPWIFWPRRPDILESILSVYNIPQFEERSIESIFIGNYENQLPAKYRENTDWAQVVTEFHCTKGTVHKFSPDAYLMKLRTARFGLCLPGFGVKCHREVELMAMGTVPIITPNINITSFANPPVENVHYLTASSPDEFRSKIENTSVQKWTEMSRECHAWYMQNCHSISAWHTTLEQVLYNEN